MLISCTFLRGFQQFKLSWMHEEISYKFCLETIVIPSLPKNSQRTMSYYYSFGHQPTYPNCSWYHHGPKKQNHTSLHAPSILLGDRFHPYHQKIRDRQIEKNLGSQHFINIFHMLKWLHSLQSQIGILLITPSFFFFFGGKNLSFCENK